MLLIAVFLVASSLANLISSPFNDLLSEQVENKAGGAAAEGKSFFQVLVNMGPILVYEIKKYIFTPCNYFNIVFSSFCFRF